MQGECSMERTLHVLLLVVLASFTLMGCGSSGVGSNSSSNPVTEYPFPDDSNFVDRSSPIGFYSDGSLKSPGNVPEETFGLLKIFRLRDRGYATDTLARTLQMVADALHSIYPNGERLQVGDTADHDGGFLSGHASHQNGLDADIIYFRNNHFEENPNTNGPSGFTETFVKNGKISSNFDVTRNWMVLKYFVSRGNVNRVFVDPVIKKTLCDQASMVDPGVSVSEKTETLRRLRPYANHDNHFHLRLKCPRDHTKCTAQDDPPAGSGCSSISSSDGEDGGDAPLADVKSAEDELGEDSL